MGFKATNQLLSDAYARIKGAAYQTKRLADARSALFANGGTESEILAVVDNLTSLRDIITQNSTIPGLAEYAKAQEDDPLYDIVAEYNTMLAAIDSVLSYITNNIPAPRTFDAVQLAPLKTELDNLSLTID